MAMYRKLLLATALTAAACGRAEEREPDPRDAVAEPPIVTDTAKRDVVPPPSTVTP